MGDLTISAIRQTVVDFTQQFFSTQVAIAFKTGDLQWTYLFQPLQVTYEKQLSISDLLEC